MACCVACTYKLASFVGAKSIAKIIIVTKLSQFSFCKTITYIHKTVKTYDIYVNVN